jgi:uncharacterized protein
LSFLLVLWAVFHSSNERKVSTSQQSNPQPHAETQPKMDSESHVVSKGKTEERDEYGATALMRAAIAGDTATARMLIVNGADVNGRGSSGWTPLMYAANSGHVEVARVLLAEGADVNAEADNGHTALMCIDKGTGMVQVLLAAGANVNAQRRDGMTALMIAVVSDNAPMVKVLLAKGADVDARVAVSDSYFGGWTALNFAEWKGDSSVVRLLSDTSTRNHK